MSERGMPVEMQCYRTPDPAKATSTEELDLLERLRPAEAVQERLLIVSPDPTTNLDSGDVEGPGFWDYAQAEWVRVADRPDLDPLAEASTGGRSSGRLANLSPDTFPAYVSRGSGDQDCCTDR